MATNNTGNGGTTLLLIDVQNDFHPGGSLAIPTANDDAERISDLILNNANSIDRIVVTLDSHHKLHIAHPSFWESGDINKAKPEPFNIITSDDILSGKWKPRSNIKMPVGKALVDAGIFENMDKVTDCDGNLDIKKWCIEYTHMLEERGRFKLCIWPEHCLIGSPGHCVVPSIREAMQEWSEKTGGSVEWVHKGQNLLTEMYSAMAAEVPLTTDNTFNQGLQDSLIQSDLLLCAGQALSHCVNYTVRDIVEHCSPEETSKICLLTDCSSAVPGFEEDAGKFKQDMKLAGIKFCLASEVFN